ncbi:MAG: hypothetical protein KDD82_10155, partial [Planctomycetes bacterium]|nr:hypothetical protein [Planctomycetota bacterium]
QRDVPLQVVYPVRAGRYPLVVASHGAGGNRSSFSYQAADLASHGYVVVSVEHVFSNNVRLKRLFREGSGWPRERTRSALVAMVSDPRAVLERPRDVSFAIDRATAWTAEHPQLGGRIDVSKVAVMGHSFGAYTTLAAIGARPILDHLRPAVAPGEGLAEDLSDPRVTAGIAFSPQGPGTSRFSKASYATIDRPLLCLSGSMDDQLGHDGETQPAKVRLEILDLMPPGEKLLAWLENADHLAFTDNDQAWMLPSPARDDAQRLSKRLTLAFCDLHLKGDARAKQRLNARYANTLCGEVVTQVTWFER